MLSAKWLSFSFGFVVLSITFSVFTKSAAMAPGTHLIHLGWDKMAAIFQTIFSNAFSWMKMYKFWLIFDWSLFPRVQLTIFQWWFWQWLGAVQARSHYLNQWCLVYWCIYASLSLNELTNGLWAHNWNLVELFFCLYIESYPIMPEFSTCHDSWAVMTCAKFGHDWITIFHVTAAGNFMRFEWWAHKPFVK